MKNNFYLHIGNHKTAAVGDVIGIFDLDHATVSPVTKKFLSSAEKNRQLVLAAEELPRSFVLIAADPAKKQVVGKTAKKEIRKEKETEKEQKIYLTQLSTATLAQRTERKNPSYV